MSEVSPCAVVEAVRQDLLDRSRVGVRKYGTTLEGNLATLEQRLQHMYEEMLDDANYCKWAILELQRLSDRMAAQFPEVDAQTGGNE